jgi:hypothetical protein
MHDDFYSAASWFSNAIRSPEPLRRAAACLEQEIRRSGGNSFLGTKKTKLADSSVLVAEQEIKRSGEFFVGNHKTDTPFTCQCLLCPASGDQEVGRIRLETKKDKPPDLLFSCSRQVAVVRLREGAAAEISS